MTAAVAEPPPAEQKEGEDQTIAKMAWVARTRSGAEEYNTLTPRWEFAFSV
jgi:hypothetical protein